MHFPCPRIFFSLIYGKDPAIIDNRKLFVELDQSHSYIIKLVSLIIIFKVYQKSNHYN
jgi:hypothetical protein